jgi:hypothetical protein
VIATWDPSQASLLKSSRSSVTVRSPEPAI